MHYLNNEHFLCELAQNFPSALEKIQLHEYDCILLDLMIPGGDGLQILQELKKQQN